MGSRPNNLPQLAKTNGALCLVFDIYPAIPQDAAQLAIRSQTAGFKGYSIIYSPENSIRKRAKAAILCVGWKQVCMQIDAGE